MFHGNESEQRVEEMVADKFGLTDFVVSTDAGMGLIAPNNSERDTFSLGR